MHLTREIIVTILFAMVSVGEAETRGSFRGQSYFRRRTDYFRHFGNLAINAVDIPLNNDGVSPPYSGAAQSPPYGGGAQPQVQAPTPPPYGQSAKFPQVQTPPPAAPPPVKQPAPPQAPPQMYNKQPVAAPPYGQKAPEQRVEIKAPETAQQIVPISAPAPPQVQLPQEIKAPEQPAQPQAPPPYGAAPQPPYGGGKITIQQSAGDLKISQQQQQQQQGPPKIQLQQQQQQSQKIPAQQQQQQGQKIPPIPQELKNKIEAATGGKIQNIPNISQASKLLKEAAPEKTPESSNEVATPTASSYGGDDDLISQGSLKELANGAGFISRQDMPESLAGLIIGCILFFLLI